MDAPSWTAEEHGYSKLGIRLTEIPRWREDDREKWMEFYHPRRERWIEIKAHWAPVLQGLVRGEELPECEARLKEARPDMNWATRRHVVRKVVNNLDRWDMIKLVTPEPPDVFGDRFQRVEKLGSGGMGVVWRCRDLGRGDRPDVAVKHAWNWKMSFENAEASIRQESELLERFDHPSIMELVDTFEHDGRFHMAREYLDGRPLVALCGRPELDERRRVRVARRIAEILDYLRAEGWFYFDVSPDNFFVEPGTDKLTLADLGLCEPIEDGLQVRSRVGTRRYGAPEMIGGGIATERSHVYSLGRLYWKMVMGRIPVGRSTPEKVRRQDAAIAELLRESRASEQEVAFFEAACRTEPDERPATLGEALGILEDG